MPGGWGHLQRHGKPHPEQGRLGGASEGSPPEPLGRPHEARGDARPRGITASSREGDFVQRQNLAYEPLRQSAGEAKAGLRDHSRGVELRLPGYPRAGRARAPKIDEQPRSRGLPTARSMLRAFLV
jgi:hypothetical protein